VAPKAVHSKYSSSTTSYATFRWAIFPEAIALVAEEKIIIFCLHPHTTHVAQPLDVSFFGPLKQHWAKVCHDYMADIPRRVASSPRYLVKHDFRPSIWLLFLVLPNQYCPIVT